MNYVVFTSMNFFREIDFRFFDDGEITPVCPMGFIFVYCQQPVSLA